MQHETNEETVFELNRNEIMDILGIKSTHLKTLEKENRLNERLNIKGYKFIEKVKRGRNAYYKLKILNDGLDDMRTLNEFIKSEFGTNKIIPFSEYFSIRIVFSTCDWQGVSIKNISNQIGISKKTIGEWDKKMREKDILKKEGFYYYKRFKDDDDKYLEQEISYEEYKSFWKNKAYLSAIGRLKTRYENGEITLDEYTVGALDLGEILKAIENKYCFRVRKYIVNHVNKEAKDAFNLMKKVYLTDIGLDFLKIKK